MVETLSFPQLTKTTCLTAVHIKPFTTLVFKALTKKLRVREHSCHLGSTNSCPTNAVLMSYSHIFLFSLFFVLCSSFFVLFSLFCFLLLSFFFLLSSFFFLPSFFFLLSARLSHAQHGTCTHERDKSPDREVRSCLLSNVRVRRALLPFLLRSLYAPVVVVYLSVDVALHGAHGRFSSVSGLVRDGLVAVGLCSDYYLARAPRSLPPPSAVAARDAGWQSATLSHGFPLVFRETIQVDGEVKGTMFEGALRCSRRVRPHGHCCACLLILVLLLYVFLSFCFFIALSVLRISISVALTLSLGETLGPELPFLVVASRRFRQNSLLLTICQIAQFTGVCTNVAVSGISFIGHFSARGAWTTDSVYCLVHKASRVIAWTTVSCSTLFSTLLCY